MPRGKKSCEKCGTVTGPRSYACKNCGSEFKINKGSSKLARKMAGIKTDWKELEENDFIKVVSGSGPFWQMSDGEKIPMGYFGKFKVRRVDDQGIHAYPIDKKNSGHCYIYMGERKESDTGVSYRPHKVRKLTHKPKITNPGMTKRKRR